MIKTVLSILLASSIFGMSENINKGQSHVVNNIYDTSKALLLFSDTALYDPHGQDVCPAFTNVGYVIRLGDEYEGPYTIVHDNVYKMIRHTDTVYSKDATGYLAANKTPIGKNIVVWQYKIIE